MTLANSIIDPPRKVTVTSGADFSSCIFIINGKDGARDYLTENITGPDAYYHRQ